MALAPLPQAGGLLHPDVDVRLEIGQFTCDRSFSTLLRLIQETGSIHGASNRMQLPCITALEMLSLADQALEAPLVAHRPSGCALTETGCRILEAYDRYCNAIQQQADCLFRELFPEL